MNSTIYMLVGKILLALAQAGIVISMSAAGYLESIGYFVLGLSLFTPAVLLFGMNSRNRLAVDACGQLEPSTLISVRIAVSTIALILTCITLAIIGGATEKLIIGLILLATRAMDQVSDVTIGFYQRESRFNDIALSHMVRALSAIPFLLVWMLIGNMLYAVAGAFIATVLAVVLFDLRKHQIAFAGLVKVFSLAPSSRGKGAMFPFLDSLHLNSYRYALALTVTPYVLGLVGTAQFFYAPAQMVLGVMGYKQLVSSSRYFSLGNIDAYKRSVAVGTGIGFGIAAVAMLCFFLIPEVLLVKVFDGAADDGRRALLLFGFAMLFWGASGFLGQGLVAQANYDSYTKGPLVGLVIFWVMVPLIGFGAADSLLAISIGFFISVLARCVFSLIRLKRAKHEI